MNKINKKQLYGQIINQLETVYQGALDAAKRAHETATDEENEAENKYDTLGLEAAYLAEGQSKRVIECENDLNEFKSLLKNEHIQNNAVVVGSLVHLRDDDDRPMTVFIGPAAGGLTTTVHNIKIIVITSSSPLCKALIGKEKDDVGILTFDNKQTHFVIEAIE